MQDVSHVVISHDIHVRHLAKEFRYLICCVSTINKWYPLGTTVWKISNVFNMPGQTSSVSSSYLHREKNFRYKYVRKRVVLSLLEILRSKINTEICTILNPLLLPTDAHNVKKRSY